MKIDNLHSLAAVRKIDSKFQDLNQRIFTFPVWFPTETAEEGQVNKKPFDIEEVKKKRTRSQTKQ